MRTSFYIDSLSHRELELVRFGGEARGGVQEGRASDEFHESYGKGVNMSRVGGVFFRSDRPRRPAIFSPIVVPLCPVANGAKIEYGSLP